MAIPTLGIGLRALFSVMIDNNAQWCTKGNKRQADTLMATRFVTPYESDSCRHFIFSGVRVGCCGAPVLVLAFVLCCCCVRRSWFLLLFVLRILSTVRTEADCAHTYCDGKKVGNVRADYLNTKLKTLNTEIGDIKYRIILKRGCLIHLTRHNSSGDNFLIISPNQPNIVVIKILI